MFAPHSLGMTITMIIGYLAVSIAFVLRFKIPKPGVKGILKILAIISVVIVTLFVINIKVFN